MRTLLLIDIQNDFLPGGALAVPKGDTIIPIVNQIQSHFDLVVASLDWHPSGHKSFASSHSRQVGEVINWNGIEQILWPDHCVQGTYGAEFPELLNQEHIERIVHKGIDPEIDSYGAFFDNQGLRETGLADYLREKGAHELYFAGLATDYCVKYSVLDGLALGFHCTLIEDACRGIDLDEGDIARALAEVRTQGARIIQSQGLLC